MSRPTLVVVSPGLLGTVQDLGRPGLQRQGVSEGGAIDPRALWEGAALLEQPATLAALEMTLVGGTFRAEGAPVRVALTGAAFEVAVNETPMPWRTAFTLSPGQSLTIGRARDGVYGYLHLQGGIDVPSVLGSRSTHVRASFGGIEGRAVRAGDRLCAGAAAARSDTDILDVPAPAAPTVVRILWGVHADEFTPDERARFLATTFRLAAQRDRMGARLDGAERPFTTARGLKLISDAVVLGDVQIPGDGQPVVLLADRQPTGGYPRIATVSSADLPAFAQLPTGAPVRFAATTPEDAVAALRARHDELSSLPERVRRLWPAEHLRSINLIDGVHAA